MAHFAKLDENNIVLEVIVVNNDALDPSNEEISGIEFLTEWSGGHSNWKQTSYNGNIRANFASIGYTYDPDFNVFISPRPYLSWKLNYTTCQWEAPVVKPEDVEGYIWKWSEINKEWIQVAIPV